MCIRDRYWLVYAPLCGLCYVAAEITNISINGTALFFMIPNLFQPQKVHAMSALWLLPVTFIAVSYTHLDVYKRQDTKRHRGNRNTEYGGANQGKPGNTPRCQSGRGEEEINRNSGNGSSKRDPSVILHQCQDGAFFKRTLSGRVLCIIQDRIFLLLHRLRLCISSHQLLLLSLIHI